jgi:hypothetical protein
MYGSMRLGLLFPTVKTAAPYLVTIKRYLESKTDGLLMDNPVESGDLILLGKKVFFSFINRVAYMI